MTRRAIASKPFEPEFVEGLTDIFENQMVFDRVIGLKVVAYSYYNGKRPGVSLSADTLVWRADADRFGGGAGDVDEDEFFLID